jgi:branched-chain amino acid aminotransferase
MKDIKWGELPFSYMKTNGNVRCSYSNDVWSDIEFTSDEHINLHIASASLHYGQQCFEGLKAYRGKDNKIRLFRWQENSLRLNKSADRILMPNVPADLFKKALIRVIKENEEFVPPYGHGASLYIRPLLIGTNPQIGINPAIDYMFLIFCSPVGPYFKAGFSGVDVIIYRDSDRAAPLGTGNVKVGGNYAASLLTLKRAHAAGYNSVMFLDPKEKEYIDECGPANFFAIKDNKYITPKSPSILPSITNMSLMTLATDMGLEVEQRPVHVSELNTFDEAGQCGTAAVITPIKKIFDFEKNQEIVFGNGKVGDISTKLYETLVGIQYGEIEDKHNWITIIE